jgi:hypothetical protein
METQPKPQMTDRHGRTVRVKKVPMSTGKKKFKSTKPYDPTKSPFETFQRSNGSGRVKSF